MNEIIYPLDVAARLFALVVFVAVAAVLLPPARRLLSRVFEPYNRVTPAARFLEMLIVTVVWVGIASIAFSMLATALPFTSAAVATLRPAVSAVVSVLDVLKFAVLCACILLAGMSLRR